MSKRLAQCLNSRLPSGVHQKTIEVYSYIFSLIGVRITLLSFRITIWDGLGIQGLIYAVLAIMGDVAGWLSQ